MRNVIDVIQVMILILMITASLTCWVVGIGVLDSNMVLAILLMLVGAALGILAKLWIYGKN